MKSSSIFYPSGTTQVTEYPTLKDSDVEFLESNIDQMANLVVAMQNLIAQRVAAHFDVPQLTDAKAKVAIVNRNLPIANSYVDENGQLVVQMDVRLLQATFRGALVSYIRENAFFDEDDQDESDDQLLQGFLDFRENTRDAKSGNLLGDLIGGGDRLSDMIDNAEKSDQIQSRYLGTVIFVIAHELGHQVLRHNGACDTGKCDAFAARELAADRYAGYLLGMMLAPLHVGFMGLMTDDPPYQLNGSKVFFDDAFNRIGFVDPSKSACNCAYPNSETRKKVSQAATDEAQDEFEKAVADDPSKVSKLTIMKFTKKPGN
jgi:hypothetical protein